MLARQAPGGRQVALSQPSPGSFHPQPLSSCPKPRAGRPHLGQGPASLHLLPLPRTLPMLQGWRLELGGLPCLCQMHFCRLPAQHGSQRPHGIVTWAGECWSLGSKGSWQDVSLPALLPAPPAGPCLSVPLPSKQDPSETLRDAAGGALRWFGPFGERQGAQSGGRGRWPGPSPAQPPHAVMSSEQCRPLTRTQSPPSLSLSWPRGTAGAPRLLLAGRPSSDAGAGGCWERAACRAGPGGISGTAAQPLPGPQAPPAQARAQSPHHLGAQEPHCPAGPPGCVPGPRQLRARHPQSQVGSSPTTHFPLGSQGA